jgi:hypothetical protein
MFMNFVKLTISALLFIILFGCEKYPEGPSFSLRTKENRLCQEWNLTGVLESNGIYDDYNLELHIFKDGSFTKYYWDLSDSLITYYGNWAWVENQEAITLDFSMAGSLQQFPFGPGNRVFIIKKLKYTELVIMDKSYETDFSFLQIK